MIDRTQEIAEALREQWEWLRVTLSSIGDAVITTDISGNVTFLNPVAQSLTGWTQEDAVGKSLDVVFKIINEETRLPVEDPAAKALREGVVVDLAKHTLLIAKDGTERPVEDSAAPIRNAKGNVAGAALVFRDATERRRQEQHVQDALTYADNIIATMREPFLVLDEDLRVKTANRSFYQTFHVSQEETEGCLIYDLGAGQWNNPGLRTLLDEVLAGRHAVSDCNVEHDFPEIGKRIMLLNARHFESIKSQSGLILLAIEDITERRKAEIAVQTSEVQYRRLFQNAQDGILVLDAITLEIIDANRFITELLGYSRDELLGKELWEIGFFGDKQASQAVYQELQERGYVRYEHLPLETKNGESAEVEFISNLYLVDDRAVAQCNIRDISERSRMERKLHEQAEALADLQRRKDEFLAMLSHELRNPLAPISSAVHLLRLQQDENSIQQQARAIIERQVTQLTRLVDDLMDVSRITTGRILLRNERIAMNDVVEHAVETTRPLVEQRKHELSVSLSPLPIWLNADAARLEQVIVNLLTNAAKYTDEGGHIWLTVLREGDECVIRLRDTGVGITPELLPRIFDMFTQAERSLDRSRGGLGIGLALVQRLVEMHGGRVDVHSVLTQGSEFVVRLPAVPSPTSPLSSIRPEAVKPAAGILRVLVVDDNVDAAESLALLVKLLGHNVRMAHDGPAALQAAIDYLPNVVLLDIGLPGLTGYEVASEIRQQTVLNGVVLAAVTGYGQESDRLLAMEAGFDHHLVKPVDFETVQQILATASGEDIIGTPQVVS
jgi:PAS domain S-box-containing protein